MQFQRGKLTYEQRNKQCSSFLRHELKTFSFNDVKGNSPSLLATIRQTLTKSLCQLYAITFSVTYEPLGILENYIVHHPHNVFIIVKMMKCSNKSKRSQTSRK